uniref:Uncharacterized protein n=1 Tax=Arundo donax TaxID=35708 RepID=A0A0A9ECX5_ARUDO
MLQFSIFFEKCWFHFLILTVDLCSNAGLTGRRFTLC